MADLTPTNTLVKPVGRVPTLAYEAGETLKGGQLVYLDRATQRWLLSRAAGTLEQSDLWGIVLGTTFGVGQVASAALSGEIDMGTGAGVNEGSLYLASNTPGQIMPSGDLIVGWNVSMLGFGSANNILKLHVRASMETLA